MHSRSRLLCAATVEAITVIWSWDYSLHHEDLGARPGMLTASALNRFIENDVTLA